MLIFFAEIPGPTASNVITTSQVGQPSSFTCVATELPAPVIRWTYNPNLGAWRIEEVHFTDGEDYQLVSNATEREDGGSSTVTSLNLTAGKDGSVIRCKTGLPTAEVKLAVIGAGI